MRWVPRLTGPHHEPKRAARAGDQAHRQQAHQRHVQRDVRQRGSAKQELGRLRARSALQGW